MRGHAGAGMHERGMEAGGLPERYGQDRLVAVDHIKSNHQGNAQAARLGRLAAFHGLFVFDIEQGADAATSDGFQTGVVRRVELSQLAELFLERHGFQQLVDTGFVIHGVTC